MDVEHLVKKAYAKHGGNFDGIMNEGLQKAMLAVGRDLFMAGAEAFIMKPCPFCGFEARLLYTGDGGKFRASCFNEDCGCELPPWVLFDKDECVMEKISLAIKYWNERDKELGSPSCG